MNIIIDMNNISHCIMTTYFCHPMWGQLIAQVVHFSYLFDQYEYIHNSVVHCEIQSVALIFSTIFQVLWIEIIHF